MMAFEPYVYDRQVYQSIPEDQRWILNKLQLAERLGYICGPSGTNAPVGEFIIRPIMNLAGMGTGGVFRHKTGRGNQATPRPTNDHVPAAGFPGHFWCEAFDGAHQFCEYINDMPVASTKGILKGDILEFTETTDFIVLPDFLTGFSLYLLVEAIDGKIIEASPRHIATCARQESIDHYRTIDPEYNPTNVEFGFTDMRRIPFGSGGWTWQNIEETRRPFRGG